MQTNNNSRGALSKILVIAEYLQTRCGVPKFVVNEISEIEQAAKAALAEPVRNYEVGTAEEQLARFIAFCKGQRLHSPGHADTCNPKCPCRDGGDINLCALTWAQMPYVKKEGGAK